VIKGFDRRLAEHFDWPLFWLVILISFIGLMNLFSATFSLSASTYFVPQVYWFLIGFAVMVLAFLFDYRLLERIAYPVFFIFIALLLFVLFRGRTILGAKRWIELGLFSFQPSELMKIVMIFTVAKFFHGRDRTGPLSFLELVVSSLLISVPLILILIEPDLGTALMLFFITFSMVLLVGVRWKALVVIAIVAAIALPGAWFFVLKDYQKERVYTFIDPEKDPLGSGYQVIQAKIAVGSGLVFGKGYLKGTQSKLQFLPKQHTDFIMSNFSEEWGFLGSLILMTLFGSLIIRGFKVAMNAKEKFGTLLAFGLTAFFFWQIFINIGMEIGLLPVVGVTLPFLSYGGSSLITNLIAVGLLLNISMRRYMF
jgi:rod shape determining protein RodA